MSAGGIQQRPDRASDYAFHNRVEDDTSFTALGSAGNGIQIAAHICKEQAMAQGNKKQESSKEDNKKGGQSGSDRKNEGTHGGNNR